MQLILHIAMIIFMWKYFEQVWGSTEILRFTLFTSFFAGIVTLLCNFVVYQMTSNMMAWLLPVSGADALLIGFLVGVKQLMPDAVFKLLCMFDVHARHFAMIFILLHILMAILLGLQALLYLPLSVSGWIGSWLYLRFLMVREATELRGDPSPEMEFVTFFPAVCRGFLAPCLNGIFHVFEKLHCCTSFSRQLEAIPPSGPDVSSAGGWGSTPALSGRRLGGSSESPAAERNLQLGNELVNARLQQQKKGGTVVSGSLADTNLNPATSSNSSSSSSSRSDNRRLPPGSAIPMLGDDSDDEEHGNKKM